MTRDERRIETDCGELGDLDRMPFSKYAGTYMEDVPHRFFHHLISNGFLAEAGKKTRRGRVADYIIKNKERLEME